MDLLNLKCTQQDSEEVIPAEELFGEDAKLLEDTCKKILHHVLRPYEGCPTLIPLHVQITIKSGLLPEKAGFMDRYLDAIKKWQRENPKEAQEILSIRKNWENERDRQFEVLHEISKRAGLSIRWHGDFEKRCRPDMWDIYRDKNLIARICL